MTDEEIEEILSNAPNLEFAMAMLEATKDIEPHDYSKGPCCWYDNDNGITYVYLKDCSMVAEWIGPDQTAIEVETSSRNRDEVVGCSVWCDPNDPRVAENFAKYEERKGLPSGSLDGLLQLAKDTYKREKNKAHDASHHRR